VDGRADQYALGCVAYALLTGSVPFKREVPMAVLYAHLSAPPPRVTDVRPDLAEAVDQVIARAMAKEPDDRYGSCGDFADALREALSVEPYDPSRPVRPNTQTWWASPAPPAGSGRPPAGPLTSRAAATAPLTVPPDPLPTQVAGNPLSRPATAPSHVPPAAPATWTAVVAADRAYYDSVQAVNEQEAGSIVFPSHYPERRFRLSGTEVRIGRRSVSRRIEPELDLTEPTVDPGVSRLHAVLTAGPDGTWSVTDADSDNGLRVNGRDVPPHEAVPLRDGDRIHLGAWTVITITRG
jgi:hypothetical protein